MRTNIEDLPGNYFRHFTNPKPELNLRDSELAGIACPKAEKPL